ncbi:MAG: hypothetical protein KIT11_03010 [Fimbriimonadaceae bacterium]|nr:hypothetical protein [Fimbriimonadaceae bacterium]QYK57133.1 MAG: hypothetical protein KF733_06515 [Fimbriimonadaceae bacterium]
MQGGSEKWKAAVLQGMALPAWLTEVSDLDDVVVSSRIRMARNYSGYCFPNVAPNSDLEAVSKIVRSRCNEAPEKWSSTSSLSDLERWYLVSSRLVSPEFKYRAVGRIVAIDADRRISILVNEEDHVRLQVISRGGRWQQDLELCDSTLNFLERGCSFARDSEGNFLSACPTNCGAGSRFSTLLHLIGLSQCGDLQGATTELREMGAVVRGIFGETSRAVGAFFQISFTGTSSDKLHVAIEKVVERERLAREAARRILVSSLESILATGISTRSLSMEEAIKLLSWVRWGACAREFADLKPAEVDQLMVTSELFGHQSIAVSGAHRASSIRIFCESLLKGNGQTSMTVGKVRV